MQNKGLIKFFAISICIGKYLPTFVHFVASKVKAMQNLLLMEMLTKK
jgi:hypothetical protein